MLRNTSSLYRVIRVTQGRENICSDEGSRQNGKVWEALDLDHWFLTGVPRNYVEFFFYYYYHDSGGIL